MPFTPFHLGPGAAFKAVGGRHFSFMVFGGSQLLMDIEPAVGLSRGWPVLHGYSHTLAGAAVIGTVAAVIGRPISRLVLGWLKIPHYPLSWLSCFLAAYVGTFSHLVLDALMHGDMRPWWPLTDRNGLLGVITINQIHGLCISLGVLGALIIACFAYHRGRA